MNGVPTTASLENPSSLIPIIGFEGLFVIVGLAVLTIGLYQAFASGGWFVGTPSRIIAFRKGKLRSIDWEQFSGDITVKKSSITLGLRTGKMVRQKRGSRYVPETIYISGISNPMEIEAICRKRIKENDPTPAGN